jgi:hypothetical protein
MGKYREFSVLSSRRTYQWSQGIGRTSIGIVGEHLPQISHFAHHLGIVSTERRHAFA